MELDGLEGNSTANGRSVKLPKLEQSVRTFLSNATRILVQRQATYWKKETSGQGIVYLASTSSMSLRCVVFKEDIHAGILDGKEIQVSLIISLII